MTLYNIIEIVRQSFPKMGEMQMVLEIDLIQKWFVEETGVNIAQTSLSGLTSAKSFSLPTGFIRLNKVIFLNSNGETIYNPLMYNVGNGKITFDDRRSTITSIPTSISKIVLEYVKRPTTLVDANSSLEIPEQFHGAILSKMMELLHTRVPTSLIEGNLIIDWNAVRYWNGEYKKYLIQAKKYVNCIDSTPYNILSYESAATIPQITDVDTT